MKLNVAVVFGGISVEHDISVITGVQALNAVDKGVYNVIPVYIDKVGEWYYSSDFFDVKVFSLTEQERFVIIIKTAENNR